MLAAARGRSPRNSKTCAFNLCNQLRTLSTILKDAVSYAFDVFDTNFVSDHVI